MVLKVVTKTVGRSIHSYNRSVVVPRKYSLPVVLLIDESSEVERIVNSAGYRSFTSPEDFKSYIWSEILGLSTVQK